MVDGRSIDEAPQVGRHCHLPHRRLWSSYAVGYISTVTRMSRVPGRYTLIGHEISRNLDGLTTRFRGSILEATRVEHIKRH